MTTAGGGAQTYGQRSEMLAARHLRKRGYKIIECNYNNALGEIDIIAEDQGVVVFIEVKARRSTHYGSAKWAVTPAKQRRLTKTALAYLKKHRMVQTKARFDVVAIQTIDGRQIIEVVTNAFEAAYP